MDVCDNGGEGCMKWMTRVHTKVTNTKHSETWVMNQSVVLLAQNVTNPIIFVSCNSPFQLYRSSSLTAGCGARASVVPVVVAA